MSSREFEKRSGYGTGRFLKWPSISYILTTKDDKKRVFNKKSKEKAMKISIVKLDLEFY